MPENSRIIGRVELTDAELAAIETVVPKDAAAGQRYN